MKKIKNHLTPANYPDGARPVPAGRPQTAAPSQPVFDSMELCNAIAHVPTEMQKGAKKSGCEAFRSNRVYLYDLLKWLFTPRNEDEEGEQIDWGKLLKKFQALREEIHYEEDKGSVLPADAVRDGVTNGLAIMFSSLERIFATEFPAACKGMDEIAIRAKARVAIEELRTELLARFNEITPEP